VKRLFNRLLQDREYLPVNLVERIDAAK